MFQHSRRSRTSSSTASASGSAAESEERRLREENEALKQSNALAHYKLSWLTNSALKGALRVRQDMLSRTLAEDLFRHQSPPLGYRTDISSNQVISSYQQHDSSYTDPSIRDRLERFISKQQTTNLILEHYKIFLDSCIDDPQVNPEPSTIYTDRGSVYHRYNFAYGGEPGPGTEGMSVPRANQSDRGPSYAELTARQAFCADINLFSEDAVRLHMREEHPQPWFQPGWGQEPGNVFDVD
ncbi:uncharacterized protein I303_108229 [Kwoniella dejecticola CBS 10117]|uniref:Uncharacterized protein n=1 Tax=Kwoniella dejecticola CBS 10117 TaxID=1296121 RepID=A0A1A5ZXZ3_9TREE|nr:uncharacterized protein I303_07445 [Kwoniella dejecticola CBS 10117]OBR82681.1 hypothetical protein I303_07445 [Kwoniella dejecticola CBS 10117]